jgi:hypothetical protein
MRNAKGIPHHRAALLASAKAERELVVAYQSYLDEAQFVADLAACFMAVRRPMPAIPVPRAGRPLPLPRVGPGRGKIN